MTKRPILYSSKHYEDLVQALLEDGVDMVHVTNGAFAARDEKVISEFPVTTAAGFEFVADHWIKKNAPNIRHAFIVAIHGKDNMISAHNVQPDQVDDNEVRAERAITGVRKHFSRRDIPVFGAAFDDISAVPIESYLEGSGFDLGTAYKFGASGLQANKFAVFHESFRQVFNFPYADQAKKNFMIDKGPWDGSIQDPRDAYRHQPDVAFYHATKDIDRQTKLLEVVDLFSTNNPAGKQYLTAENKPTFDYKG